MSNFLPQFPLKIPFGPGLPIGWDILWWIIGLLGLLAIVWVLTRLAIRLDAEQLAKMRAQQAPIVQNGQGEAAASREGSPEKPASDDVPPAPAEKDSNEV